MPQFEFLVMTEKNLLAYKFFVIKYIRLQFFFYVKIKPPPPLSQEPPLKVEVLLSPPPHLKIWLEVQPPSPSAEKGKGGKTVHTMQLYFQMRNFRPKKSSFVSEN